MIASESMVQDQSEGSLSKTDANSRLDDRFSAGKAYALKARKPYTITKQREKWTQEEHKKFLEALKLYGRSWRQIEEHMGNKTAIQIRSHAQKFFTKVVRESSGTNGTEVRAIHIPPPRAKRKPTHPYPRKVSVNKPASPMRSTCQDSSRSDNESMSPGCPESVSTQSLKLFGTTFFVTGSTSPSSMDSIKKLPWDSMPNLAPECHTTRSLIGCGDLSNGILRLSDRIEPTTQCGSQDGENGGFGNKGERCAKGFVPYKRCLAEERCVYF